MMLASAKLGRTHRVARHLRASGGYQFRRCGNSQFFSMLRSTGCVRAKFDADVGVDDHQNGMAAG